MPKKPIVLRPPKKSSTDSNWNPPRIDWLEGTWHVTHSTLSAWKTKKNVRITYESLPLSEGADTRRLDDLVSYQDLNSEKTNTIHGIDTSSRGSDGSTWDWRGTGFLFFVTSHWEILGWGDDDDDDGDDDDLEDVSLVKEGGPLPVTEKHEDWVVTYFTKTFFTPAGIDIYSRSEGGLSPERVARIRAALSESDDKDVRRLAVEIFEVVHDATGSK